jgi:hypothetical protein
VINPAVEVSDEDEVITFLVQQLRAISPMADAAGAVWEQAGTLRIARREPELTSRGKLPSLVAVRT